MADNTIVPISKQYLNNVGKSIDAALQPCATFNELSESRAEYGPTYYTGMEKIMLNSGSTAAYPMKLYLKDGNKFRNWQIKEIFPVLTHEALDNLVAFTIELGLPFAKFTKGLEVTVVADEQNEGKPTKYWITAIDSETNTITWERCNNSSEDAAVSIEGNDMEQ